MSLSANATSPLSHLKLVGKATLDVLFWDIYTAHLYTPSGHYKGLDSLLTLRIVYHRDITKEDLNENTLAQWQHLFGEDERYPKWIEQLDAIWPNLTKGDELSVSYNQSQCDFFQKQVLLGTINDPSLCERFLSIWLSEKTSRPKLRKQLIGE